MGYYAGHHYKEYGVPTADCAPYTSGSCHENRDDHNDDGCTTGKAYTEGTCWGGGFFSNQQWTTFGRYDSARITDVVRIDGYKDMQADIAAHGPLTAYFDFFKEFQRYHSGILPKDGYYTPDKGAHAILITGYASDQGTPYWRIRNSWGVDWGEDGYVRFLRRRNFAHIETDATSIIVGPRSIEST